MSPSRTSVVRFSEALLTEGHLALGTLTLGDFALTVFAPLLSMQILVADGLSVLIQSLLHVHYEWVFSRCEEFYGPSFSYGRCLPLLVSPPVLLDHPCSSYLLVEIRIVYWSRA